MENYVVGVVVSQGQMYRVALRPEWLVVDTAAWAMTLREQCVEDKEFSQAAGEIENVAACADAIAEIDRWLAAKEGYCWNMLPLLVRQSLGFQDVTRENWQDFVGRLLQVSQSADPTEVPQFYLHADGDQPALLGTRHIKCALSHSSFVRASLVTPDELVALAMDM